MERMEPKPAPDHSWLDSESEPRTYAAEVTRFGRFSWRIRLTDRPMSILYWESWATGTERHAHAKARRLIRHKEKHDRWTSQSSIVRASQL